MGTATRYIPSLFGVQEIASEERMQTVPGLARRRESRFWTSVLPEHCVNRRCVRSIAEDIDEQTGPGTRVQHVPPGYEMTEEAAACDPEGCPDETANHHSRLVAQPGRFPAKTREETGEQRRVALVVRQRPSCKQAPAEDAPRGFNALDGRRFAERWRDRLDEGGGKAGEQQAARDRHQPHAQRRAGTDY